MRPIHAAIFCTFILLAPTPSIAQPKTDIQGISPGMPVSAVTALIERNKWFCASGPMWGTSWHCPFGGRDFLYINRLETLKVVGSVSFRFVSGGSPEDIVADIEGQYGTRLMRLPKVLPTELEYIAYLNSDLTLKLLNSDQPARGSLPSGSVVWTLALVHDTLETEEEKARAKQSLQEKPVPKF